MSRGYVPEVPAHAPRRGRRARLGRDRRAARHRRRLRRPPRLRGLGRRPGARGAGLPGGNRRPAALGHARGPASPGAPPPPRRHHRGCDGFPGQPLHGPQAPPLRRRLHARRGGGPAPRPGGDGLRPAGAPGLRADDADRHRRRGSLAPAHRPLRLLGRPGAAVGPRRQRRRPARLRAGGEAHRRDRPAARLRGGRLRARRRAGNRDGRGGPGDGGPGGARAEDARPPGLRGGGPGQAHLRPLLEALPPRAQPRERAGDGAAPRPRQGRAPRGGERADAAALHRGARRGARAPLRARRPPLLRRGPHPGAGADPLERGHPARLRRRVRLLLHHRAPGARRLLAQPRRA